MKGNIKWQVQELFLRSGINQIGQSRHNKKISVRNSLILSGSPTNRHNIGKKMGIHSYKTADVYRAVWRQIGKFVKNKFKLRDFEKFTGEHILSYLDSKIKDGVAHSTFMLHASACEKLEVALDGYARYKKTGREYRFSEHITEARKIAHIALERPAGSRAYDNPTSLIETINDDTFRLVAQMQLEGGPRIRECSHLTAMNLKGVIPDPFTKEKKDASIFRGKAVSGATNTYRSIHIDAWKKRSKASGSNFQKIITEKPSKKQL